MIELKDADGCVLFSAVLKRSWRGVGAVPHNYRPKANPIKQLDGGAP